MLLTLALKHKIATFWSVCFFSCFQAHKRPSVKVLHRTFQKGKKHIPKKQLRCLHVNMYLQTRNGNSKNRQHFFLLHIWVYEFRTFSCPNLTPPKLYSPQLSKKGAKLLTSANLQFLWQGCSYRFCLDNGLQLLIQQRVCSVVRVQFYASKYSWIWKANKLYSFLLPACSCVFVEPGFLLYDQSPAEFPNWADG